jgi:two-component system LytT family sensor kinase
MKGLAKGDLITSLLIGASYFLLWAVAIIISVDYNSPEFWMAYGYTCWQNGYGLMVSLLLFHVLIPFVNTRKSKIGWGIGAGILVFILISAVYQSWLKLGMQIGTYPAVEREMMTSGYVVRGIIYLLYGIAYFTTIKLLLHIIKLKDRNNRLQLEKKNAELNYLKSQTNPHFLFNTLNNLYSLAEERSPHTAGAILRLSAILRFMLYESDAAFIAIGREMKIIREYIELERMRYDDSLNITIEEEVDESGQLVPPLLLIPLVENAFKHGVSETIHQPFIRIKLQVRNGVLFFVVENSKSRKNLPGQVKENIGLSNLRRQLDLLFSNYTLEIKNEATSFQVCLSIHLNSYGKV